jgi:hypothetical protein
LTRLSGQSTLAPPSAEKSLAPPKILNQPARSSRSTPANFINAKAQKSSPLEPPDFYWKTVKMSKITVAGVRQNVAELLDYS